MVNRSATWADWEVVWQTACEAMVTNGRGSVQLYPGAGAGRLAGGSIPGSIQQLRAGSQIEGTGVNRDDTLAYNVTHLGTSYSGNRDPAVMTFSRCADLWLS